MVIYEFDDVQQQMKRKTKSEIKPKHNENKNNNYDTMELNTRVGAIYKLQNKQHFFGIKINEGHAGGKTKHESNF